MAGPPDQTPAAGRGDLRASHGDREQVIGALKAAFVQGRLAKDEFDLRVGQAFASRTYADLAVLTADIPAGLAAAQPSQPPWAPGEPRLPRPGLVLTVATVLYAGVWPVAFVLPDSGPDHDPHAGVALATTATLFYVLLVLMVGTQIFANWLDKRSARRLPQGPAPGVGGQAPRRLPSADPGGQLPPAGPGHQHSAEAARKPSSPPALAGLTVTAPLALWRVARWPMACHHAHYVRARDACQPCHQGRCRQPTFTAAAA